MRKAMVVMMMACVLGGWMPAAAQTGAPMTGAWECLAKEAAFSPRDTAEGVIFDGKMWLSNAYSEGNVLTRDLWSSADGVTWDLVSDNTPYDGYSEMVVFDGKIWAIKSSVWCSTDGAAWTQVLAETPFGVRSYGELVVHEGKMWQLGSGADVWNSADGKDWTRVLEQAPYGGRYGSAVAAFAGKLWLAGGCIEKENTPPEKHYAKFTTFNDVWCSTDGVQWERVIEHAPWAPRMWVVPAMYAGRLWIVGGFDNVHGANLGDVWSTQDGATWQELDATPRFAPRHEVTCYVYQDRLWVVAGNTWPVVNDVWRLTLNPSAP